MQLIINIQNDSIADKIKTILSAFKNDGVEIEYPKNQQPKISNQQSATNLTDEYIKEHWRELVMTGHSDPDYYKSEQYKVDRATDWEERGKI